MSLPSGSGQRPAPSSSSLRLFFGVDPGSEAKRALELVIASLRQSLGDEVSGVRWTLPENLHFTLKFLGETSAESLPRIISAAEGGLAGSHRGAGVFSRVGIFKTRGGESIIYAGVHHAETLPELAGKLDLALEPLAYKKESRAFRPHVTLARIRPANAAAKLNRHLQLIQVDTAFPIDSVTLFQSKLTRGGPIYTPLRLIPLDAAAEP